MHWKLLEALMRPTLDLKRHTIEQLTEVVRDKAMRSVLPIWCQWTIWLALAITIRRIEEA